MSTFILFIGTVASFLFYGVIGEDKAWLLAPLQVAILAALVPWMVERAGTVLRRPNPRSRSSLEAAAWNAPISTVLWILLLLYFLVHTFAVATVAFDARLLLVFMACSIGAFWFWGEKLASFKDSQFWLSGLLVVVMLTALYGLIIHIKQPESVLWVTRYTDHYNGRLASTYICPNHFAHLLQMLLPFCLVLASMKQSGVFLRILAGYSFLIFLPPLYLTESRAGWLGSMVAVGVTVCLMALRRSKKLFALLIVLVPLLGAVLLFAGWTYSETFQRRMTPVVNFLEGQAKEGMGSESRDFRPQTWMDTLDLIKTQPLLGTGGGNYRYAFPEFRKRFKGTRVITGHPHNEYLELISDYGWVGFGLFALAWCYGLFRMLRYALKTEHHHHALLAMAFLGTAAGTMVHSFFDFQMHVLPNTLVFAMLAGAAAGPMRYYLRPKPVVQVKRKSTSIDAEVQMPAVRPVISSNASARVKETVVEKAEPSTEEKTPPASKEARQRHRITAGIGYACVSFLFLLMSVIGGKVMSSHFMRAMGDRSAMQDQPDIAKRHYKNAIIADGTNWDAYAGLAALAHTDRYYTLELQKKTEYAQQECAWFTQALQYNPLHSELLFGYGKVLLFLDLMYQRGYASEPLQEKGFNVLRSACERRQFNDDYWWHYGRELRLAKRYEEALMAFQHAASVRNNPSIQKNIEWISARLNGEDLPSNKKAQVDADDLAEMLEGLLTPAKE